MEQQGMNLKKETTDKALGEFAKVFGLPPHLKDGDNLRTALEILHRELSRQYTEETFPEALEIAWQQARRFPCIADFHRGFDAPERDELGGMPKEYLK